MIKQIKISKPKTRRPKLHFFNLVGIKETLKTKNNWFKVLSKIDYGMELLIKHEPNNKFDSNALAVFFKKKKIGYIARRDSKFLLGLLKKGKKFHFYSGSYYFLNAISNTDYVDYVIAIE